MKQTIKKLTSLFMAVCMILTAVIVAMPITASAATNVSSWDQITSATGDYVLTSNITVPAGATYYFHSAHYRDHSLAVSPMTDNHDEIINFLSRCVLSNESMQHTNEFVDDTLEPCQTEFTIQEYLNTNYS